MVVVVVLVMVLVLLRMLVGLVQQHKNVGLLSLVP